MLVFPNKRRKYKDLAIFDNGYKTLENVVVIGERTTLYHKKTNTLIYTKGAAYQLDSTLPKCAVTLPFGSIDNSRCLCFPGCNYRVWYHIVIDVGFQIFLAKKLNLARSVVVPALVKNHQPVLDFLNLFGVKVIFVNHPRKALKVKSAIVFDKFTGRLSEAISGGKLNQEIRNYFCFLTNKSTSFNVGGCGEKIFSTRRGGDSRVCENFSEIEKAYISQGYQVVYFGGMSLAEQIKTMSSVTHFAGFHGSNLANIVFAPNLKYVQEVVSGHYISDFKKIAQFKDSDYSLNNQSGSGRIAQPTST